MRGLSLLLVQTKRGKARRRSIEIPLHIALLGSITCKRGNEDPWPHPEIANPPHLGQGTRQWGDGGNHRGYAALPNPTETEHKDCINESSGTQRTHNIQITRWKWTPACHHRSWYFRHKATKDLRKLNVANRRMHSFCSSSTTVR